MPGSNLLKIWVMVDGKEIVFEKIRKSSTILPAGAEVIEIPAGAFGRVGWLLEKASAALFKEGTFPKGEVEYWDRWLKQLRNVTVSITSGKVVVTAQRKSIQRVIPKNISFYFGGYPKYPRKKRNEISLLLLMQDIAVRDDPAPY